MILFSSKKHLPCIAFFTMMVLASCNNANQNNISGDTAGPGWLLPFNKLDDVNPVMQPGDLSFTCPIQKKQVKWESKNVFNPAIAVKNDTLFILYRAQDSAGCSRIGLAKSTDGIHFKKNKSPVLFPDDDAYKKYEWPGGCEDPRLIQDSSGIYYITYTAYDGKTARLMIATSTDLIHWEKHGPAFTGKQYENLWSKSGSVICDYINGKIIAKKIKGRYYMYWGDKYIWIATSPDLIHWAPQTQTHIIGYDSVYAGFNISNFQIALPTRKGKFDCDLVESGPPAIFTNHEILLIYNSRNIPSIGDKGLPMGTYTVSQALFDKNDPCKLLSRMDNYFIKPDKTYEFSGEVNNVCFAEALAFYKNKWWLYYGTADSKIAVAVKNK